MSAEEAEAETPVDDTPEPATTTTPATLDALQNYLGPLCQALLGATPVALATSNSFLSFPVDMGLAIMFPLHGHIGMNYVITDYVPKLLSKAAVGPARAVMVGVTGFTMLGLTKLNVEGPGITGTLKALWRKE